MSSPLAKTDRSFSDKMLIQFHQASSHGRRVDLLAQLIVGAIESLRHEERVGDTPRIVDVGCGDMRIAEGVMSRLPSARMTCVDVHPCSDEKLLSDERWSKYVEFDGIELPFNEGEFDVGIVCDVLHHTSESRRIELMSSISRTCRYVIIKDHFEYGLASRTVLRLMDFVGNYGYGISVPERYFTQRDFEDSCRAASLDLMDCSIGIDLYGSLPLLRWLPLEHLQFLAICKAGR